MHQPAKNGDEVADYGNITVTARELASVLGLSEAQVYTLRRRSILQSIKAKRTEFLLGPSIRAYIQYKCGQESESQADFHKERALKEKANRELREILVEQTRDQLHRACDVEAVQADSNADIRSKLSEFATLLSSQIAGKSDPAQVKDVIDTEVRKVLNKLREYKPRDYYRRQKSVVGAGS
jgi:ATP sulfurylase